MNTTPTLRDSVLNYCAQIGANPLLVQGAGGNVSWKDGDTLWVKASGAWLADALTKDIFVSVDLLGLRAAIQSGQYAAQPILKQASSLRPSIETLLHALMPQRVVVHIHALEALVYLVRENGLTELNEKLKNLSNWSMVCYHKPGAALARAVAESLQVAPKTNIVFFANHGLIVGGDDVECIESTLHKFLSALAQQEENIQVLDFDKEIRNLYIDNDFSPIDMPEIHSLARNEMLFDRVKNDWALYPDHVVFLGSRAACYESFEKFISEDIHDIDCQLIFIKAVGVFIRSSFSLAKKTQLLLYFNVVIRQSSNTKLKSLSIDDIADLSNWDAELYRRNIAK